MQVHALQPEHIPWRALTGASPSAAVGDFIRGFPAFVCTAHNCWRLMLNYTSNKYIHTHTIVGYNLCNLKVQLLNVMIIEGIIIIKKSLKIYH